MPAISDIKIVIGKVFALIFAKRLKNGLHIIMKTTWIHLGETFGYGYSVRVVFYLFDYSYLSPDDSSFIFVFLHGFS